MLPTKTLTMEPYLEKCLPLLRKPFIRFPRLHCHPYSWLSGIQLPATLDHSWAKTHFYLNFFLFMGYTFFGLCRAASVWSDPTATLLDIFLVTFMSSQYVAFGCHYATVMQTRDTFVPFLRRYIRFLQSGEKNLEINEKNCRSITEF